MIYKYKVTLIYDSKFGDRSAKRFVFAENLLDLMVKLLEKGYFKSKNDFKKIKIKNLGSVERD